MAKIDEQKLWGKEGEGGGDMYLLKSHNIPVYLARGRHVPRM